MIDNDVVDITTHQVKLDVDIIAVPDTRPSLSPTSLAFDGRPTVQPSSTPFTTTGTSQPSQVRLKVPTSSPTLAHSSFPSESTASPTSESPSETTLSSVVVVGLDGKEGVIVDARTSIMLRDEPPFSVMLLLQVDIDESTGFPIGTIQTSQRRLLRGLQSSMVTIVDGGDGLYIVTGQGGTVASQIEALNEFLTQGIVFVPSGESTGIFPSAITVTIVEVLSGKYLGQCYLLISDLVVLPNRWIKYHY